jgi:hypothetical protein
VNVAFPVNQTQPRFQVLAAAVKQPVSQGKVVRLAQHIVKPQVRNQKVVHGAAQIMASALAALRVPMQIFDRAGASKQAKSGLQHQGRVIAPHLRVGAQQGHPLVQRLGDHEAVERIRVIRMEGKH